MRVLFTNLIFLLFSGLVSAQTTFSDDFEAYTDGAYVAASNNKWTTWSAKPGTTEDAKITTEFAKSGTKSLKIINTVAAGGATDLVLPFGGRYTTGRFDYKMSMLIPTGKNAYFNFQGTTTVGQTWSLDANFSDNGLLTLTRSSAPLLVTNIPINAWFDLEIDINLTSNVWKVLINGECRGAFANPSNAVASIDFFPTNTASLYYVDDLSFRYEPNASGYLIDGGLLDFTWSKGKLAGTNDIPKASIINNGNLVITSFDLQVTIDGKSAESKVTGQSIAKGKKLSFDLPELTLKEGSNVVEVLLTKINGLTLDEEPCNNKLTFTLVAAQAAPHRAVLVEEGTGTWCQWCPRGAVFMDKYNSLYPDLFIPIAVHNGSTDPMLLTEYDKFMAFPAFPNSRVNRTDDIDPSATEGPFLDEIGITPDAKLTAGARFDEATKKLDVSVEVEFLQNTTGQFYVTAVLTEDSVTGTASGYNQANAYANNAAGVMGGYELLPNPVPASKMIYDHVARAVSGLKSNNNNSFSGSYKIGDKILLNYSFTLNATWNSENMHIVPIMLNKGEYVNASRATIAQATANGYLSNTSSVILSSDNVKIYPNPAQESTSLQLSLSSPQQVEVTVTSLSGQIVSIKNYGVLDGDLILPVNLNVLQPGIYLFKIKTDSGTRIEKVAVK